MKVLNYTPHKVIVMKKDRTVIKSYPSDGIARVSSSSSVIGDIDGIELRKTGFGEVTGLPEPEKDTYLIVSSLVRSALPDRKDLISPDTSPTGAIRDEKTNFIVGVTGFQQ